MENINSLPERDNTDNSNIKLQDTGGHNYRVSLDSLKEEIVATAILEDNKHQSYNVYLDVNRVDDYVENGTINKPYKTISAVLTVYSGITVPIVLNFVPGTYIGGGDITLPNAPITIYGNGSTISNPGHTITFTNPNSARYNLFTTSNIIYSNFSSGARNMVIGGSIAGNITNNAYTEFIQCQLNGGIVDTGATGLTVLSICSPTSKFTGTGVLMFNGINMNTGYAGYLINMTGGLFTSANSIIYNTSTSALAGGISCNNGATISAPNMIVNTSIITAGGGVTAFGLNAGTAYTLFSKNNIAAANPLYYIYGTHFIPVSSDIISGGTIMGLGSDATGDIYYRNALGLLTRLPKGTDGQTLKMVSGLPAWA